MTKPGVISAIERGTLSEVIDTEGGYRGRRLLWYEMEEMARAGIRGRGGVRGGRVKCAGKIMVEAWVHIFCNSLNFIFSSRTANTPARWSMARSVSRPTKPVPPA